MPDLIRVYPFKVDTGEVNPKTKKPVFKVTYHTETDGKGDLIKSVVSNGQKDTDAEPNSRGQYPSIYYAVKDKDGNRLMSKDVHANFIRENNKRLGNADLKRILKRATRFIERSATNRKIVAKLTKEELLQESQEEGIISAFENLLASAKTALLAPVDSNADEETPDIF